MTKEVLLWCQEHELNAEEVRLIAEHDTFHNGLNCTIGGEFSPMLNPEVVDKVRATWDRKFAETGADEEAMRRRKLTLERMSERRAERKQGIEQDAPKDGNPRRLETWGIIRAAKADEWEAARLAAEDAKLEGMDVAEAETMRHNSRKAKERRLARYAGEPLEDGRLKPSAKRDATWAAKLEERIKHLSPKEQDKQRRKAQQRRKYKAGLRAKNVPSLQIHMQGSRRRTGGR